MLILWLLAEDQEEKSFHDAVMKKSRQDHCGEINDYVLVR